MNDIITKTSVLNAPERTGENNDCAVCATAFVLGTTYADAHALLKAHGRKNRRGTKTRVTFTALQTRGTVIDRVIGNRMSDDYRMYGVMTFPTVAQFIRQLPKTGRFWISAGGHAIAYVNGQLIDNLGKTMMRARVKRCFEVTPNQPPAKIVIAVQPTVMRQYFQPAPAEIGKPAELQQSDISAMWARLQKLEAKL